MIFGLPADERQLNSVGVDDVDDTGEEIVVSRSFPMTPYYRVILSVQLGGAL